MLKSLVKSDTQGFTSVNCHHFETNLTTYHSGLECRCTLGLSMVGCPFETYHRTYHFCLSTYHQPSPWCHIPSTNKNGNRSSSSDMHVRFDGRLDGRSPTRNLPSTNPVCIGIPGRYGRLLGRFQDSPILLNSVTSLRPYDRFECKHPLWAGLLSGGRQGYSKVRLALERTFP